MISREEIRQRLWPADTFVDFEHSVNTSVKTLRQALGDSAEEPQYVETLPKLGYRFIGKVEADSPPEIVPAAETVSAEAQLVAPPIAAATASRRLPRRWFALAGALAVVIAAVVIGLGWFRSHAASQPPAGRAMFAVLPFENLTGDASQEYFSDGLTEEMISRLGRTDPSHVGVIARTSVMHYKHSQEPLDQIGRELGVQYVLEGSVRRDANRVRISAQMIEVKDQTPLWARQYDRDVNSLLAVQGEIAQEIGDEIQLTLGRKTSVGRSLVQGPLTAFASESHDLFLRGLYSLNKRTPQGFQQAVEYFTQATAKDPTNAPAYAGLADAYSLMSSYSPVPNRENMEKARAAALRALELDEKLAEAHTALALIVENYDWDWQAAEREYLRAIQLDANYATAHQWYAECLAFEGRFQEAFAESARARELDPLSLIIAADHGAILYYSRQYDRATAEFRSILEVEPTYQRATLIIRPFVEQGKYSEALAEIDKAGMLQGEDWTTASRAFVYARMGQKARAKSLLKKFQGPNGANSRDVAPAVMIAAAYAGMGDADQAFPWLEKICSERSSTAMSLKVDAAFDPVRQDPRFQNLLRKLRLAE